MSSAKEIRIGNDQFNQQSISSEDKSSTRVDSEKLDSEQGQFF